MNRECLNQPHNRRTRYIKTTYTKSSCLHKNKFWFSKLWMKIFSEEISLSYQHRLRDNYRSCLNLKSNLRHFERSLMKFSEAKYPYALRSRILLPVADWVWKYWPQEKVPTLGHPHKLLLTDSMFSNTFAHSLGTHKVYRLRGPLTIGQVDKLASPSLSATVSSSKYDMI